MTRILLILLSASIVMAGCTKEALKSDEDTTVPTESTEATDASDVNEKKISWIELDDVNGITADEAIALCESVIGTVDEISGFEIGYSVVGAGEYEGEQYYIINVTWFVENHHWSYVGNWAVSADGDKIYDADYRDENCCLHDVHWEKDISSKWQNLRRD